MRAYEVMYIIKPDVDEEKINATVEKFNALIQNNGGEVVSAERLGKRRLAYEIDDYREGFYVLVNFNGVAATAQELERVMKITDEVLRHLATRKEE